MKLEISREDDRLTVAAILIKNGYRVSQLKERKSSGKAYNYYLEADRPTTKGDTYDALEKAD